MARMTFAASGCDESGTFAAMTGRRCQTNHSDEAKQDSVENLTQEAAFGTLVAPLADPVTCGRKGGRNASQQSKSLGRGQQQP
jgi:hypothetical protein